MQTITRVFEPADYDRAAQFLYLISRRNGMTGSLTASFMAQSLASQFAADYGRFETPAFMRAARTGQPYLPDFPDESDIRAEHEVMSGDQDATQTGRVHIVTHGTDLRYRYSHKPQAAQADPQPYTVVPVRSSDGVTWYEVRVYADGRVVCDPRCKGYTYRQQCRHTDEVGSRVTYELAEDFAMLTGGF